MDSHHQEQLDAWIPGAVAEEEPVVSSHSHSHTLILAHALSLTDLQWAMPVLVVSCTQSIQPRVSTMYTLDPRPLQIQPPHPPHAPRRPTSHSSLPLKILSPSLACPPSPSSITSSSSAIPEPVSPLPTLQPHFLYSPPPLPFSLLLFFFPLLPASTRTYTPLKVVGDGSFGTVWLCDWHGTLPPNTPLSAMQCGPGARPEYANKRLVAVKRMKKRWEGGWDECKKLKELEARSLQPPVHPCAHSSAPHSH